MQVVILRGIPGAGKSTLAHKRWPDACIVSADHFFMVGGKYQFNPAQLGEAHGSCLKSYLGHIQMGDCDVLVVDNTNISIVEMAPYVAIAQAFKVPVQVITVATPSPVAGERNVHGVPPERVAKMGEALNEATKSIPPWWDHIIAVGG